MGTSNGGLLMKFSAPQVCYHAIKTRLCLLSCDGFNPITCKTCLQHYVWSLRHKSRWNCCSCKGFYTNYIVSWSVPGFGESSNAPMTQQEIKRHIAPARIYKIIILPVALYGCEPWPLTLREGHRLRVLKTGCWEKYLDRREMKWQEDGENCIMRSFVTCTLLQV
jgi:hypothetical protein